MQMKIKWWHSRVLRKLIDLPNWNVAIRKLEDGDEERTPRAKTFVPLPYHEQYWFADPFLFERDGVTYLFVEAYNRAKRKGEIGVFEVKDGECVDYRTVLKENFHLSYPLVFERNGEVYMIPEAGESNAIRLYKAAQFPYQWELDCILQSNEPFADSTILRAPDDKEYLLSYVRTDHSRVFHTWKSVLFSLDFDHRKLTRLEEAGDKRVDMRPAGYAYCDESDTVFATQKNDKNYGEALIFWKRPAGDFSWKGTRKMCVVSGDDILIEGKGRPFCVHTYTRTGRYEVIDYKIFSR